MCHAHKEEILPQFPPALIRSKGPDENLSCCYFSYEGSPPLSPQTKKRYNNVHTSYITCANLQREIDLSTSYFVHDGPTPRQCRDADNGRLRYVRHLVNVSFLSAIETPSFFVCVRARRSRHYIGFTIVTPRLKYLLSIMHTTHRFPFPSSPRSLLTDRRCGEVLTARGALSPRRVNRQLFHRLFLPKYGVPEGRQASGQGGYVQSGWHGRICSTRTERSGS